MPKIFIYGQPKDLYRYKMAFSALLDKKDDWGVTVDYLSRFPYKWKKYRFASKIRNLWRIRLQKLSRIIRLRAMIKRADYIYIPPMVLFVPLDKEAVYFIKYCNRYKKKVIGEVYVSQYDTNVIDRHRYEPGSKEANQCTEVDIWLNNCYRSIYLNPCEAKRYRELCGLGIDSNVRIIPLSISSRPFAKLNYFKKESDTFNMVWWGTYIPLHGLDKIIDAVSILANHQKKIHLYIMGYNPGESELAQEHTNHISHIPGLESFVTIREDLTFSNGKLLPFILDNCDLAFGAFGDSDKAKTVILNKAIEAVAMKIPLLTQYSEAFSDYFNPDNTIFYCANNPEDMAQKISHIMDLSQEQISLHIEKSYEVFEKNFSFESTTNKFKELLDELND